MSFLGPHIKRDFKSDGEAGDIVILFVLFGSRGLDRLDNLYFVSVAAAHKIRIRIGKRLAVQLGSSASGSGEAGHPLSERRTILGCVARFSIPNHACT